MLNFLCRKRSVQRLARIIPKRFLNVSSRMANSRFDYVRDFETNDTILPNCWIVVRIDGKAFHKFTQKHDYNKPNDDNGKPIRVSFVKKNTLLMEKEFTIFRHQPDELCSNKSNERFQ